MTTPTKRKYIKREGEFFDLSIEQLREILDKVSTELAIVMKERKENKTPELEARRKDLNNKRVRIYVRLRKLGYNSSDFRGKEEFEEASTTGAISAIVTDSEVTKTTTEVTPVETPVTETK